MLPHLRQHLRNEGEYMNFSSVLSKRRGAVMGLAALMIVCFHAYWKPAFLPWRLFINQYGNTGVDFFVFLSGFGLVYSLEKSRDLYRYYGRRLERILPSYYVTIIFISLVRIAYGMFTREWILQNYFPFGVWARTGSQYWYVSAVLGYYLMTPAIYALIRRARFPRLTTAALMVFTGLVVPAFVDVDTRALLRMPSLVMGIALGVFRTSHTSKKDRVIDLGMLVCCMGFALVFAMESPLIKLPVFNLVRLGSRRRLWKDLTAPLMVVIFAYVFEFISKTPLRFINTIFEKLGKYSLEIYFSHLLVNPFADRILGLSTFGQLVAMLLFSFPVAVVISWAGQKLLALVKKLPLFLPATE